MRPDRLVYAQTWEDPELDAEALEVGPDDRVVAIGSGGCTPLSLLALGPRAVDAVDTSAAQLATIALKRAAVSALDAERAVAFLGGAPACEAERDDMWASVCGALAPAPLAFWAVRRRELRRGVLWQGRADRVVGFLGRMLRALVVSARRVEALFAARELAAQRRVFREQWDGVRWRGFFRLLHQRLLDLAVARGAYGHLDAGDWGQALRARAERCLTEIPAGRSYFAAQMFLGRYPDDPAGRPPFLTREGAAGVRRHADRLRLHHGEVKTFLDAQPAGSVDKLVLSNVDEWLDEPARAALFASAARAVRPGGRITCRALLVPRPIPAVGRLVVDEARAAALAPRERAFFNASFRVLEVTS